jgi:phenylacetyl-CoA:acceptor oxidoreductase subunit 2
MRAAGNFIAGGSGSGLIAVSALAAAAGAAEAAAVPMAIGVAGVALGLSLVWLEIGKPWRALNVFLHPQTSWMTRESIIAGPLLLTGAAGAWFASPAAMVLAGVLALGFLYCQARILRAARAIPAWRQAEIVPFIVATGFAEGAGLYLAVGSQALVMAGLAVAACAAREAAWLAYSRGLLRSGAPAASLAALSSQEFKAFRLLQAAALIGLMLSLALGGSGWMRLAGLLAAVSGWGIKALLVTRAAVTRGPAIPFTPVRGRGASRTIMR